MRDVIKNLNKRSLAETTGISYSRLRKYASNELKTLSQAEIQLIYNYLINLSQIFITEAQNDSK